MTSPLAACYTITKHFPAAFILYRMRFWYSKGYPDVAKSSREWQEETGLSPEQVRDGIDKLRRLMLIDSNFRRFGGRPVNHYKLTERAFAKLDPGQMAEVEVGQMAEVDYGQMAYLHIQENGQENLQENETAGPVGTSGSDGDAAVKPPTHPTYAKGASVADILAQSKTKDATMALNPDKHASLMQTWRAELLEHYDINVFSFTQKDVGQFKTFLKDCPQGTAVTCLSHIIRHWSEFCVKASKDAGAFNMPAKPDLPFLTKFRAVAINLALSAEKQPEQPVPAIKQVAKKAASELNGMQLIAPGGKAPAKKMTKAEALAVLNEDDE